MLAGAVLAVWVAEAAVAGSGRLWISYHRAVTAPYTATLPPLGAIAMLAAIAAASRSGPRDRALLVGALACLLAGLVVTVIVHFPINAAAGRDPAAPPADWSERQWSWMLAHGVRSVLASAGFLLVLATVGRRRGGVADRPS
ncbi:anthrone oxygenase family protein [Pseudonocardia humida]|uniref:DUF1772 domain-containing protein n=1 Tax=Pseudonocardia humida TaxID=2800819 RepID=A0ABT0ZU33_9PSEU|nr:DUF1772 domain-containing protein [Pseudonocardia humida]MCO1654214.1 DUF1772 domain-containing protein [Pseudonocardia humida]